MAALHVCCLVAEQQGSSQPVASHRASRVQPAASFTIRRRLLLTQHRRRGSTLGDAALPCRYYRLPLPVEGAPLEEDFDAFVNILRVRRSPRPPPPPYPPTHRQSLKVESLRLLPGLLLHHAAPLSVEQPCHFLSRLCPGTHPPIRTSGDAAHTSR